MPRKTPLDSHSIDGEVCSPEERLRILGGLPFFKGLSAREVGDANRRFHDSGFVEGDVIYYEGDLAGRLYVPATGKVKLVRTAASGQEVVLGVLARGDYFGTLPVLGGASYGETALALTGCCILSIAAVDFQAVLAASPQAARNVLGMVAARLQAAEETIHQLSAYPLEKRLAAALLQMGEKFGEARPGGGLLIQAPLSRQDLAAMTGATPEAVSRALSEFRRKGWISSGRRWIALDDRPALASLVEEA